MEELVRHNQAVARAETLRDIAGKIKPLLDENDRVFAILLCFSDGFLDELDVVVCKTIHFIGVILTDRFLGAHFQYPPQLVFAESVCCCTFRCRLGFSVGKLLFQSRGGSAVCPPVSGGS